MNPCVREKLRKSWLPWRWNWDAACVANRDRTGGDNLPNLGTGDIRHNLD